MANYPEIKRLERLIPESYNIEPILDELTRTYSGDPLFLVELKEFIHSLSDIDMAIIYLRFFGYSINEIKEELGLTHRRIEQRIKRVRELASRWIG
ncbi:MAG: hypothetical protein N2380_06655 [bacterium]|nr:hypothetical protein [bacterium]